MPTLQFKNNASTTLSGSINDTQTSITVANGANFPVVPAGDYFYATMYEVSGAVEINIEIVKVTGTTGNNWTIARGQDGTTARSRNGVTTCYIELRWTAAAGQLMAQRDNNLSDLASAATARTNLGLGTMATQAANNVSITGGSISGVTLASIDSTTTISDNVDNTKKVAFEVAGVATATTRTLSIPNASGTIALTSDLTAGYQPLDSDLTAFAALAANGLVARTGTGTVAVRAITQPAAGITVTNGDGVSGNPTLALANDLAAVEGIGTTGFVRRTAADTWSASAIVDGDLPSALTGKTYNALTLTANATGFSVSGGTTSKSLTVSNSLTLAGTDGTTITFPTTSGTLPLNNQTFFLGTTSIAINRASASISLTGVSIDGSAGSATSATTATTATNLASGALGSVPYQSAAGSTTLLAGNTTTTRQFLRQTGTGTVSAAPAWDTVTKTDVGLANVENTALSTWAGSANITTLGTIATGTWSASTIAIARGGTGATTAVAAFDALSPATTLGDLIYSDGTDNVRLAGNTTTNRRFLRQTGTGTVSAAPAWDGLQDGDIPTTLTGKTYNGLTLTAAATGFTVAGGTTSKTLTVSNTLTLAGTDSSTLNIGTGGTLGTAAFTASTAYAPAAGSSSIVTVGTVASGTWQGSAIGISYGGTGATSKAAGYNALTPITTLGDIVYGDGANSATRLAGNTAAAKRFLTQTGNGTISAAPGWNAIVDGDVPSALTGKTYNGITLTANATGFSVAGGTTSKTLQVNNNITLAGTDGSTLSIGAGGTLGSAAYTASTAYQPVDADLTAIAALTGTSGFLKTNGAGTWSVDTATYLTGNQSITVSGDASGSGTTAIALTLATVTAAKGGTGQTSYATGDLLYASGASTLTKLAGNITATKQFLSQTGTGTVSAAPAWTALTKTDVGLANVENTALSTWAGSTSITTLGTIATGTWQGTAIGISYGGTGATSKAAGFNALSPVTTLGDLVYGDGANSATRLAGNTTSSKRFLTQTGTGTVSAAPGWNAIVDGDLPAALTGKTYNGLTLTANATGFQVAGGTASKTLVVNNSLTFSGTDNSTLNIGAGGTLGSAAYTASSAYQPIDADLTAIAALTGTSGFLKTNGAGTWSVDTATYLTGNQSITLSGDATGSGATAITVAISAATVTGKALTGYTSGANSALAATDTILAAFGKVQGQLGAKAALASPTFTGTPAAPTAAVDTNTTQIATTAYVVGQGYLKSATASSTYQTISGMSSYLTTSSASSTYLALAGGALTGGLREARVAMGASDINLTSGNFFTRTISGATTLTVSNVPSSGTAASFILDLTNGGSATITWWSGMKWAGGTAPALTASGRDVLGFFTHDGGTTWTGLLLGKDVK